MMTELPSRTDPPAVVPRWEWRAFGDLADEALASLRTVAPAVSDETYVLSMWTNASVKVRDDLLDVKVLRRVDGAGLQLWTPTMKAAFPVDEADVAAAFEALGLPEPVTGRPRHTRSELLLDVIGAHDELRLVDVHKVRHRSVLEGCLVEYTEISAEGSSTWTVAAESPDPELVSATVRRLGLAGRRNTCVADGLKALLGWRPTRYAVLDVGTNSVKLVVGDRAGRTELDTAVVTRLGEGLAESGGLTPASMDRTVAAIAGLLDDIRGRGPVEIVAVGTAGLRQAPNRDGFLGAVLDRCGVAVEVISGPEEARLAYRAAVSSLTSGGDGLLVFDSGGGSSQFTFGSRDRIAEQFSLDVGAVRLTERFGLAGAVPRETVDAALEAISAELGRVAGRSRPDAVIAIGGTSTNLAAVSHGLTTYDPEVVHGTVVDVAEVDRQIEEYRRRAADDRRTIAGLQPARAEVILAGACIVRTILTLTGQQAITVSDRGLRHGVAAERFGG